MRRLAYMSVLTYSTKLSPRDKALVWLSGEVKTPPLTPTARVEAGFLLRKLQRGEILTMPHSRPMPTIGMRCHELRIPDENRTWRIIYRVDSDAIVIADVFAKTTQATPKQIIVNSQKRLRSYDQAARGEP
jgi:phage-related protein